MPTGSSRSAAYCRLPRPPTTPMLRAAPIRARHRPGHSGMPFYAPDPTGVGGELPGLRRSQGLATIAAGSGGRHSWVKRASSSGSATRPNLPRQVVNLTVPAGDPLGRRCPASLKCSVHRLRKGVSCFVRPSAAGSGADWFRRSSMAKGQKRSNREQKKPKQQKPKPTVAQSALTALHERVPTPTRKK
jgi:hypothetical protein